jgi:hypothetical protein
VSDRYIKVPAPYGDGWHDIWELDESGNRVKRIADLPFPPDVLVDELNKLWRLAEDSANMARLDERTKVRNAFLKEGIDRKKVELLREDPEPPPGYADSLTTYDPPAFMTVQVTGYNRLVRVLKAIAETAFL